MAEVEEKKEKKDGGPRGLPFYMVKPDAASGVEFIKSNTDGTYDVAVLVGLVNPGDKNAYMAVAFVNGKQLDGVVKISKEDVSYTFLSVTPGRNGQIGVALASVRDPKLESATAILVLADKLGPTVKSAKKSGIAVNFQHQLPTGFNVVLIKLINPDGTGRTGDVEIAASQNFRFNADPDEKLGSHDVNVANVNGVTVKIKPTTGDESFTFTDTSTNESVREIILGERNVH